MIDDFNSYRDFDMYVGLTRPLAIDDTVIKDMPMVRNVSECPAPLGFREAFRK